MHCYRKWRGVRPHGLTLVELLVVIAVSAVLLAIAIPSFFSLMRTSRLRGAADILMADFRLTMTESTKRGDDVLVSFQRDADGSNWCYGLNVKPAAIAARSIMPDQRRRTCGPWRRFFWHIGCSNTWQLLGQTKTLYHHSRQHHLYCTRWQATQGSGQRLRLFIRTCSPSGNSNISGVAICP